MCNSYLSSLDDDSLVEIFNKVLSHLLRCQNSVLLRIAPVDWFNFMITVDRIIKILMARGWSIGTIMPESANLSFFQQSRQTLYTEQPQLSIEYQEAMPSQEIIIHQQRTHIISQQPNSLIQDKHPSFLEKQETQREKDEKTLSKYKDEAARVQKEDLERAYQAAEQEKQASIRKLQVAEEAAARDRRNEAETEHKQRQIDELRREKADLDRRIREQQMQAEQDKREAARRREEGERQRREAGTIEEEEKWRQIEYERKRTYEIERGTDEYRDGRAQREERAKNKASQHPSYIKDTCSVHTTQATLQHELRTTHTLPSSPSSPSSSSSSSSSTTLHRDPYKLLGLLSRSATPLLDIRATRTALMQIHSARLASSSASEAHRKTSRRRMVEIEWAADILLDSEKKRAFDEAGAVFEHERRAWRDKRNSVI